MRSFETLFLSLIFLIKYGVSFSVWFTVDPVFPLYIQRIFCTKIHKRYIHTMATLKMNIMSIVAIVLMVSSLLYVVFFNCHKK